VLQVRDKEADIDSMIAPIEDMYSLLLRYEVGGRTSTNTSSLHVTQPHLRSSGTPSKARVSVHRVPASLPCPWLKAQQNSVPVCNPSDTHAIMTRDIIHVLAPLLQVRVPKEETGMVSDLRYGWRKLRKLATDTSDNLARQQVRAAPNDC
jgi:hypothetical protein